MPTDDGHDYRDAGVLGAEATADYCYSHQTFHEDDVVDAEIVYDEPSTELDLIGGPDVPLLPIAELRQGLLALDDQRKALVAAGDVDNLAYGSADLAALLGDLGALQRDTRSDLARLIIAGWVDGDGQAKKGKPKQEVEALGMVEVPGGWERKDWDSPGLLRALVGKALYDDEGELKDFDHPSDVAAAVVEVLTDCAPFTPSTGWKVGQWDKVTESFPSGIQKYGLDPNDFCSYEEKPRLAVVPKRPAS